MIFESKHPAVKHKLTQLRDVGTDTKLFRELVHDLSVMLSYEATADLATEPREVETPMGTAVGRQLRGQIGLVPVLRAGLGMVDGMLTLLSDAQVWHIGLYRDEETLKPVSYYNKLPNEPTVNVCLVIDPMLATGGSAIATVDVIKEWGVTKIKFVGILAAPEGVAALREAHPDVAIHVAHIDDHLNEIGFIVPGLGDAGDRQFGTG